MNGERADRDSGDNRTREVREKITWCGRERERGREKERRREREREKESRKRETVGEELKLRLKHVFIKTKRDTTRLPGGMQTRDRI